MGTTSLEINIFLCYNIYKVRSKKCRQKFIFIWYFWLYANIFIKVRCGHLMSSRLLISICGTIVFDGISRQYRCEAYYLRYKSNWVHKRSLLIELKRSNRRDFPLVWNYRDDSRNRIKSVSICGTELKSHCVATLFRFRFVTAKVIFAVSVSLSRAGKWW